MKRALTATSVLLLSTVAWMAALLTGGSPPARDAAALLGADLVVLGAVAVGGMLLGAARWALRLGFGVAAAGIVMALALPIGPWWIGGVATSAAAGTLLAARWTDAVVRGEPAASGPPPASVVLSLGLLALPGVAAVIGWDGLGPAHWVAAVTGAGAAVLYTRALPGALLVVRLAVPAMLGLSGGLEAAGDGWTWTLFVGLAVLFAALAWQKPVRLAVHPLARRGTAVPILPEMVPEDVLDAAGLDERGRPRT